jgi:hypothetical protein
MALKLWFQDDVENILEALDVASDRAMVQFIPVTPQASAYRQGFADALEAIGAAFGIQFDSLFNLVSDLCTRDGDCPLSGDCPALRIPEGLIPVCPRRNG